ncbi:alpha/beta hydrolase [Pleionea sp. CnH1-48]|uniref:alpha/beta hydrolase n=1 Tax=Pleionea sp. CnH1-48 TaxID=2954494 RepID=UPI002097E58B|nr:alpha/beta fold hydrolase [Pleionea sp. CnH1-48]MCO7224020.1 alpha/beta hydrolase [Pleionea sp. CnH1-48]
MKEATVSPTLTSEKYLIDGPVGQIEVVVDLPPAELQRKGMVICCHPHPVHGGAMTNKVIHTVARTIAEMGLAAVRFNFRGVGKSAGEYDEGQGERDDLRAVIAWAQTQWPDYTLWLSGFSFGSYIAAMIAHEYELAQLISIAPPVHRFDFSDFVHPGCHWLVVMGDADEVVDFDGVEEWITSLLPAPEFVVMESAGHFFHGRLLDLKAELESHLSFECEQLEKLC